MEARVRAARVNPSLIFDNTALSHFARAGRLSTLESLVNPYRCMTPVEVRNEVLAGVAAIPDLVDVLTAGWLEAVEVSDVHELAAFARYKTQLGGGSKQNTGEAAVLAWASVHGDVAIIDERAASRLAQRDGIVAHGSLWLVVEGVRRGELERSAAERLVDELRATDMRLPTDGKGLLAWAYGQGLLS